MRPPLPHRTRLLAQAGTYLTEKGVRPVDDPRRPAVHGLGLDANSLVVQSRVVKALKDAGYSQKEREAYQVLSFLGDQARFLAATHEWCSLTGGTYTIPSDDEDVEDIEVFTCGMCGHEERSSEYSGIESECMGCGFCHDCCTDC
jgi:hypothetical protein